MTQKPIAYINVEKRTLEFEKPIKWHTPTVANLDRIPLFTKEALAQEQEPVAWLITDEKINSLQVDSIQRLVDRARHAHMTDIKLRINGQDEWHQADWLKHLTRTTPPQRTWVGLTNDELTDLLYNQNLGQQSAVLQAIALLKQKNGYAKEKNI